VDEVVRVEPADRDEKIENLGRLVHVDLDQLLGLVFLQEAASEALRGYNTRKRTEQKE